MAAFPLDVWFIVFDRVSDNETLWSVLRCVSQHLRICVDAYVQRYVLRDMVIDLIYSTIHAHETPTHSILHVPVRFDRVSEDGTRAVYKRVRSREPDYCQIPGSVRGWVPFIERYHRETGQPPPRVTGKKIGDLPGLPMWTRMYNRMRSGPLQYKYPETLESLRDHASIGRGDRPPYLIRVSKDAHDTPAHDTQLHGLEIDCKAREISILWRETLSAFYTEAHFVTLAENRQGKSKVYDERLDAAAREILMARCNKHLNRYNNHWRRARRKRLAPWVAANRKRMSDIHRLLTEDSIYDCMRHFRSHAYAPENLVEIERDGGSVEIVPEKCAGDDKALMKWPNSRKEWKELEPVFIRRPKHCAGFAFW
jgi:hypothetical protein